MKEKTSVLANALIRLNQKGYPWQRIQEESNTSNLKRIADGEQQVTSKTWWRLHETYPNDIPPVVFESRGQEYIVNSPQSKNTMNKSKMFYQGERLSDTESAIIKMIRKRGDDFAEEVMGFIINKK